MDYTLSDSYDTDAGTGQRMHEDAKAIPTVVSAKDMNSVFWSLMEIVKAAGLAGQQFNKATPASYQVLLTALRSAGVLQTPPRFDNTTKAATTEFVKRQGLQAGDFIAVVGATTLTAAHAGTTIYLGGTGNYTVNLPVATTLPAGARIEFCNGAGTSAVTIARQGAASIYMNASNAKTTVPLTLGDTLVLETNGVDWYAVEGSAQLQYSPEFAGSSTANGYHKFPNGTIWQWGKVSNGNYNSANAFVTNAVTFPIPFPNACFTVVGGINLGILPSSFTNSSCESASTTGFNWVYSAGSAAVTPTLSYHAIGR